MEQKVSVDSRLEIFNPYVAEFKERGGNVVGYTCVSTPVEVLEAAGILPYRIKALGNQDTYLADGEMSLLNCSFCRSCLQLGMDGTYDFLDGVIETNGCDHMRVMYENWQRVLEPGFFHYLKIPHTMSGASLDYLEGEFRLLMDALSGHFSIGITDSDLLAAMEAREEVRREWRALAELRRRDNPPVTGSEMLALTIHGSSMMSGDFAGLLSEFRREREPLRGENPGIRLMVSGAATDELEWFEEIEALGGTIVADGLCFGARALSQTDPAEGAPLRRLAEGYMSGLFCPRMYAEYPRRREYLSSLAREARVDGIVVIYNKFCDLHGVDAVLLRKDFDKEGIPVLILEKEYSAASDIGRVRTRVQAFMEMIGGGAG